MAEGPTTIASVLSDYPGDCNMGISAQVIQTARSVGACSDQVKFLVRSSRGVTRFCSGELALTNADCTARDDASQEPRSAPSSAPVPGPSIK